MPAEWYPHKCCWMLVPFRTDNWRQNAQPAQHAFINVAQAISRFEKVMLGVHPSIKESFSTIFAERQTSMEGMGFGIELFDVEYDDCWMRDVGATFLHNSNHNSEGTSPATNLNECDASMEPVLSKIAAAHSPVVAMDWIFNAWGRKYSVWENDDKVARAIVNYNNLKSTPDQAIEHIRADFILEGGSIHVDGEGTVLVTEECLLNQNRNPSLSKAQIEQRLMCYLGVDTVIWLPRGLVADHDTDGHIDNIACFAKPGVVLLSWTDDSADPMHEICLEALEILTQSVDSQGRHIRVVKLPLPTPMHYTADECSSDGSANQEGYEGRVVGARLAGSYGNFYIANGGIIVPSFGQKDADTRAVEVLKEMFSDGAYEVVSVEGCREVLLGGGNIHCITQQQPLPR